MPPALPSMWRLCKLGYRYEPRLMVVAFVLSLVAALPDALVALWLKLLARRRRSAATTPWSTCATAGLALSGAATWFLRTLSDPAAAPVPGPGDHRARVARGPAAGRCRHSRPPRAARTTSTGSSVLRDQVFVLDHMYMSVFSHARLDPAPRRHHRAADLDQPGAGAAGAVRAADRAHLVAGGRRSSATRRSAARRARLARHLFVTATTAPPGKEVRVTGIGDAAGRATAGRPGSGGTPDRARARSGRPSGTRSPGRSSAPATSARSSSSPPACTRSPGDVLLVLAAGARLSAYIGATVGEIGFLRGIWMDGSRRLAWLEDYAASFVDRADAPVPDRLADGIRLEHVSFAYPGTTEPVLRDVTLTLPAGSGGGDRRRERRRQEHPGQAAVQVLRADRRPDPGRRASTWRAMPGGRLADPAGRGVPGLLPVRAAGPAHRRRGRPAPARRRAGGASARSAGPAPTTWSTALATGLDTQLGPAWPDGVDVSFGQWQKLALARGFMRDEPLLLVLDEPTAALDAETEHALFERYAAGRPPGQSGTAASSSWCRTGSAPSRMADLIVVLDGARVVEVGSHDELMARGGQYAELYAIQAAAYQ